jgi:hypothetical protein
MRTPLQSSQLFEDRVNAIEDGELVDGELVNPVDFAARARLAAKSAKAAAKIANEAFHSAKPGGLHAPMRHSPRAASASPRSRASASTPRGGMRNASLHLKSIDGRARRADESQLRAHAALDEVEAMSATQLIRRAVDLPSPPSRRLISPRSSRPAGGSARIASSAADSVDNPMFEALLSSAMAEVPRREAALGPYHPATIERVQRLGNLLLRANRPAEAIQHLQRVRKHRVAHLGGGHEKTVQAEADVAACLEGLKKQKGSKAGGAPADETPGAAEPDENASLEDYEVQLAVECDGESSRANLSLSFSYRGVQLYRPLE